MTSDCPTASPTTLLVSSVKTGCVDAIPDMPTAPAGTDLPAGNAPPPPAPTDHAADRIYGAAQMQHDLGNAARLEDLDGGMVARTVRQRVAQRGVGLAHRVGRHPIDPASHHLDVAPLAPHPGAAEGEPGMNAAQVDL